MGNKWLLTFGTSCFKRVSAAYNWPVGSPIFSNGVLAYGIISNHSAAKHALGFVAEVSNQSYC